MSTIEKPKTFEGNGGVATSSMPTMDVYTEPQGVGWVMFSAVMLGLVGFWGILEGILAISSSKVFVANATFVFSSLNTWGWVTVFIAAIQFFAAASLFTGGGFGRWVGILAASLSAIGSLMSIPAYPFWSLCIFALAIIIIYELAKAPVRDAAS